MPKLKVLFLSAEVAPIYKIGGLGDVAGTLPPALEKLGVEVTLLTGYYEDIFKKENYPIEFFGTVKLRWDDEEGDFEIYQTRIPGSNVRVLMLKDIFIYQGNIYSSDGNRRRFDILGLAGIQLIKDKKIEADLVHVNDVHSSLAILLLKSGFIPGRKIPTVLTLHNLHSNFFSYPQELADFGFEIDKKFITSKEVRSRFGLRFISKETVNRLAWAIANVDIINTVSPTYAKEILTKEFGEGVEEFLKERKDDLFGILNGIDIDQFDPTTDKDIDANFSSDELNKRNHLREHLYKETGLEDKGGPLLGVVTRLVKQKGVDLIAQSVEELVERGCQIVLLGNGEKTLERRWISLHLKYPENISVNIGFDPVFAKQIYAGCDIFLIPSRFEPCGLTQMMAMRYGSIPVAHKVGGLVDTIEDSVDGFLFDSFDKETFLKSMDRALEIFKDKNSWQKMQESAMKKDFSWEKSAKEYVKLYEEALERVNVRV